MFGKVNRKLASTTCALIAACLAIFLPLRLHYYPAINQVSFFTSFTGLVCLAHFLWAVVDARRRSSQESTTKTSTRTDGVESLSVPSTHGVSSPGTHADRVGLNDARTFLSPFIFFSCHLFFFSLHFLSSFLLVLDATESSRLIPPANDAPSPSAGAVLPAKYHFHTNVDHYHQEVRDKAGHESETIVNPYCPLPHAGPLLRVPYTCPLLDATNDGVARDGFTHVYGRENEPLFDEDFEEHDTVIIIIYIYYNE
jgi:hypothetical protein